MSWLINIIILTVLWPVYTRSENDYRVVCYHTNWAQYREAPVTFKPEDIDPFLCTHIIYAFAKLEDGVLTHFEWNDESTEWNTGNYEKFTNLKQQNSNLKLLLGVGGWNHGVDKFSEMAGTATKRQHFITHAIDFLRNRNFDGLDLNWLYPAARNSPLGDKEQFTILCQELQTAFQTEANSSGSSRLLLSAAVSANHTIIDAGYEIEAVSNALDFVNLMAFDLLGSGVSVAGHHASLYAGSSDSGDDSKWVVEYAVNKWLDGGCPPSKLNLGFAAYGKGFTLAGSNNNIGAPTTGPSLAGTYTKSTGLFAYYEICERITIGFTRVFDTERKVPYAYGYGQWVGYDDMESIQAKVNFMKTRGIGGGMVWALDFDDFKGEFCGEGLWPILNAINGALNEEVSGGSHPTSTLADSATDYVERSASDDPRGHGSTVGHGSTPSTNPKHLSEEQSQMSEEPTASDGPTVDNGTTLSTSPTPAGLITIILIIKLYL